MVPLHQTSHLYGTLHWEVKPKAWFILKAKAFCNLPSFMHLTKAKQDLTPRSSAFQPFWADWQPPFPLHLSPGFPAFITTNAVRCVTTSNTRQATLEATSFSCGKQIPTNALQPSGNQSITIRNHSRQNPPSALRLHPKPPLHVVHGTAPAAGPSVLRDHSPTPPLTAPAMGALAHPSWPRGFSFAGSQPELGTLLRGLCDVCSRSPWVEVSGPPEQLHHPKLSGSNLWVLTSSFPTHHFQ